MKVYNNDKIIVDSKMDFSCLNFGNAIDGDDNTMIPYENAEFLTAIKPIFIDVAKEMATSWMEPDYKKCKAYLYISNDEISLSVEVFPKLYSVIEKQVMLAAASDEEREDGWSDYLGLINMFDDIDEILNCSFPVGEVSVYHMELTSEERKMLSLLIK